MEVMRPTDDVIMRPNNDVIMRPSDDVVTFFTKREADVKASFDENLKEPKTLGDLTEQLHMIFSADVINIEVVKEVMERYRGNPREWRKFAKFDTHRYTRNLVDAGNGKFNLMILCWNEGQGSSIHSHANSHCFLKVLQGSVREELYNWPREEGDEMTVREIHDFSTGRVTYINDSIGLHRIENPSHCDKLLTLHLYSPPFDECSTFDKRTGKCRSTNVTFWSKYGKRTPWSKVEASVNQGAYKRM